MADQAGRLAYAHGSAFTTEPLEAYAREVGRHLPIDDPAIYPVSGGSEAIETALKLARAYHLARGEPERWIVVSRGGGATTATPSARSTCPAASRCAGRTRAGSGRFRHVSAAYPYRAGCPGANALGDGRGARRRARARRSRRRARARVAAFVAEPIVGATLAAAVPPDGYWPAIAEVCRRHGVLLIADEVMTGFGRTGRWFGLDHWGVRPDILVAAKGATSGYWPFGFVAASDDGPRDRHRRGRGFVHGFTYSHAPVGAAVAREVLRILEREDLVEASAAKGERLQVAADARRSATTRRVGEIRGRGLLVGVELVADRETRAPFPRAARVTEAVVRGARERGVLVYSGTGNANGVDGDTILLGPPFVVTDAELERIATALAEAIDAAAAARSQASAAGRSRRAVERRAPGSAA